VIGGGGDERLGCGGGSDVRFGERLSDARLSRVDRRALVAPPGSSRVSSGPQGRPGILPALHQNDPSLDKITAPLDSESRLSPRRQFLHDSLEN
jgi:hypothetical protein